MMRAASRRTFGASGRLTSSYSSIPGGLTAAQPITADAGMHATTIVAVRKGNEVVIAGDGQVTLGQSVVMKPNAKKVRVLGEDAIAGFAGSTADAITLFERLESRME